VRATGQLPQAKTGKRRGGEILLQATGTTPDKYTLASRTLIPARLPAGISAKLQRLAIRPPAVRRGAGQGDFFTINANRPPKNHPPPKNPTTPIC